MSRSAGEIIALYRRRQNAQGPEKQKQREICALYNGDLAIALPDMGDEGLKPAIVNLAKQGINQLSMRCASVMPNLTWPAVDFGRQEAARSRADKRRRVNLGWWEINHVDRLLRRRARWFFGYAQAPVVIRPDFGLQIPRWHIRSPLDTYASEQTDDPDGMCPRDVIFATIHQVGWVRDKYPEAAMLPLKGAHDDDLVEVLEYIDRDEFHLICTVTYRTAWDIVASTSAQGQGFDAGGSTPANGIGTPGAFTLERVENKVGRTPVVIPQAISMERRVGQFDGLVDMFQAQAELDVLARIARRKGVFAEEWLVAHNENVTPEILHEADPMAGIVGVVQGGQITKLSPDVLYSTDTGLDRYERNQRVEAGIPADFGGEAGAGIRTGARASQIHANVIEPVLQEAQNLFAESLQYENALAACTDKKYWGGPKSIYVSWPGEKEGTETYDPEKLWETERNKVEYALAGADANGIAIAVLQRVGGGTLSKRTGMSLDPFVKDVDAELRGVEVDRMTQALMTGFEQLMTTPGGMPLPDAARAIQLVRGGMESFEAFLQVQKEAQARQAAAAQTAAETQPGIAMPGQGAEAAPMIGQNDASQSNLRQMLTDLRRPQTETAPEMAVGAQGHA